MITAHDPNDLDSPRTARHLARFQDRGTDLGSLAPDPVGSGRPPG